jgi:hypothetical protein
MDLHQTATLKGRRLTMRFYLGTHKAGWLWSTAAAVPLFVSHRTLAKTLHRATCSWALDSGGFTELSRYGEWRTTPAEYVRAVARYEREIGRLDWAAPQDHMCEPWIIQGGNGFPGTGLSVDRHQHLTVDNFVELRELWPQHSDRPCPFIPVLQGWTVGDYIRCREMYRAAGVDLAAEKVVGLGSVCRRQNTIRIGAIVGMLADELPLHGFGVKTSGLQSYGRQLASADSMAWSLDARRSAPMPGHTHQSCANCQEYAAQWRSELLDKLEHCDLAA